MSDSKFKVKTGLAQIITSGEPVFVNEITGDTAQIRRPVATPNGIEYRTEEVDLNQLETRFTFARRNIELEQFVNEEREKYNEKRFALSNAMRNVIKNAQATNPSLPKKFQGDADVNG